ncbi:MAG: molybdate ABC transporter substrate-binding protein [Deltaproteobacteria bacterium]|nr:molybdate ABC transporter substrate-binding protein [Deltaproteobacteria bacterium]
MATWTVRLRVLLGLACLSALPGCGAAGPGDGLVVVAAASLGDAFTAIARDWEHETDAHRVRLSFVGSQVLAAQLRAGLRADVVATANPEIMTALRDDGLVDAPVRFATNRLVWVVHAHDREGLGPTLDARTLAAADRVVLAAPEVPAGRYSRQALRELGLLEAAEARLVSQELDVKGVVAKLLLGGADAGMIYATDVPPGRGDSLAVIGLDERADVRAEYLVATASAAPHPEAARRFVDFVRGERAAATLSTLGFGPP